MFSSALHGDRRRDSYSLKARAEKNRKSRLLVHVNFDGQNHRFVKKSDKYGFLSGFGHYFPDFGYLGFASK